MNRPLTLPSPLLGERVASRRVRGFGGPNARNRSGNSLPLEKRSKPARNFSRYSETQIRK
jgi:hypothetical protein